MSTNEPGTPDPNRPEPGGTPYPGTPQQPGTPQPGTPQQPGVTPQPASGQPGGSGPSAHQPGGMPPSAPGYPQTPSPGGYMNPYPKNSLGVWSLVLGIASFIVCPILASIGAIVTGHMSRKAVREGQADNGGLGMAGLILGWASLVLSIVAIVIIGVAVNAAMNDPNLEEIMNDPSMWATLDPEGY